MCSRVCVFAVVGLYLGSRDSNWTDRVSETIHFLRLHGIVLLHLRLFGSEANCWGIFHFIFVFTGILATSIVKSLVHCLLDGRSEIQQQAGFILLTITTGRRSSRTRGSLQTCTWCWSESGASGTGGGEAATARAPGFGPGCSLPLQEELDTSLEEFDTSPACFVSRLRWV